MNSNSISQVIIEHPDASVAIGHPYMVQERKSIETNQTNPEIIIRTPNASTMIQISSSDLLQQRQTVLMNIIARRGISSHCRMIVLILGCICFIYLLMLLALK